MNKKYIELALLAFVALILVNNWDTQVTIVFILIATVAIIHTIESEAPRVQIQRDLKELTKTIEPIKPKVEPVKPVVDERLTE